MNKTRSIILGLIFLTSLPFLLAISYPHAFHGLVQVESGQNPDGQMLIGKINGVATGSCTIQNGEYAIIVLDNVGGGGKIEFFIGNEKAKESSEFETFEVTALDLTFDKLSSNPSECGNDVCDLNECSSCAIDCGFSDCNNNSRCDIEIGEDCASSPEDCGICEFCGDTVCNNDESCSSCSTDCGACPSDGGGGGGGGGGSGGGATILQNNQTNDSITNLNFEDEQNSGILSTDELNEETIDEAPTRSGITGAVVGFVKEPAKVGVVLLILIIAVGITMFVLKKKRNNY